MRRPHGFAHRGPASEPREGSLAVSSSPESEDNSAREAGSILFVVDGIHLTLEDIESLASMHEGWQFSLHFADPSGDLL